MKNLSWICADEGFMCGNGTRKPVVGIKMLLDIYLPLSQDVRNILTQVYLYNIMNGVQDSRIHNYNIHTIPYTCAIFMYIYMYHNINVCTYMYDKKCIIYILLLLFKCSQMIHIDYTYKHTSTYPPISHSSDAQVGTRCEIA